MRVAISLNACHFAKCLGLNIPLYVFSRHPLSSSTCLTAISTVDWSKRTVFTDRDVSDFSVFPGGDAVVFGHAESVKFAPAATYIE